jgi:hypothetical protein
MDVMDFDLDEEEDLSTVLGTESLAARDMVSEGFDNTLRARGVLELTQLGRWYTTRPYTGRQAQAGRPACCERCLMVLDAGSEPVNRRPSSTGL